MEVIHKYRSVNLIALVTVLSLIVTACGEGSESVNQSVLPITPVVEAQPTLKLSSNMLYVAVGETFTLDVELDTFPVTEGGPVTLLRILVLVLGVDLARCPDRRSCAENRRVLVAGGILGLALREVDIALA